MKNSNIYYNVGPLLYCPASSQTIAHSIVTERFGHHFSLALCLEDTIADDFILEAENQLIHSLHLIQTALSEANFYLPQIFIRVRDSQQISRLFQKLAPPAICSRGSFCLNFLYPTQTPISTRSKSWIQDVKSVSYASN